MPETTKINYKEMITNNGKCDLLKDDLNSFVIDFNEDGTPIDCHQVRL